MAAAQIDPLSLLPQGFSVDPAPTLAVGGAASLPPGFTLDPVPQMTGPFREPALIGSNLAQGLASAADMTGQRIASYGSQLPKLPGNLQGIPFTSLYADQQPIIQNALTAGGIINRPDLQPQSTAERYLAAGAQGAGTALPFAMTGGIPAIVSGATGGMGAQLGATVFPNNPEVGSILGGVLGGGLGGGTYSTGVRSANALRGVTTPLTGAYDRLGIRTDLAGDVTGNPFLQRTQAFSMQAPAGGKAVAAAKGTVGDFGNAVENTASTLGPATTMEQAGTTLQQGAQNWLSRWKQASQNAWNNVDMFIPGSTKVSIGNYDAALDGISKDLADAQNTAQVLQPTLSRSLFDALQKDAGASGTLSWQAVKGIRTRIGEMLSDPKLVADTDTAELKRLYGALTQDMQTAAQGVGPQAVAAFNDAASLTRGGHFFIDNAVSKILGGAKNPATPGQAVNFALGGAANDASRLNLLRAGGLGPEVDNLAAWKLRDMALANPGAQGAEGTTVSPGTFLTEANKLSPEGAQALYGDPRVAQNFADLRTVAHSMKETARLANSSNTGPYLTTRAVLDAPENAIKGAGGGFLFGGPLGAAGGAIGSILGPFMPGYLGSRLTASPLLTRFMASPGAPSPLLARTSLGLLGSVPQQQLLPAR